MKYKVGDRVKIQSLERYNTYKNRYGDINYGCETEILFTSEMSSFCGQVVTITRVRYIGCVRFYHLAEDKGVHLWVAGMFEGLVEEEAKPKFKVGDEVRIKSTDIEGTVESIIRGQLIVNYKGSKIPAWPEDVVLIESVEEETKPKYEDEVNGEYYSTPKYLVRPSGYQFKDENGNIINATKIVLEKKKKEYPKTFEECVHVLEGENRMSLEQMNTFRKLIDARNAYWKLAGEEMGLGKPWEPDWKDTAIKYVLTFSAKNIIRTTTLHYNYILAFPTEEMRDAFKENFDPDIEFCKEFL